MGGPSREVTIRFNADFSNARKEMAAYAKDSKKFHDGLGKDTADHFKGWSKGFEGIRKDADAFFKETAKSIGGLTQTVNTLGNSLEKAVTKTSKSQVSGAKETEKAFSAATKAHERAITQQVRFEQTVERGIGKVAHLGKTLMMLYGTGEKNTEKMLQNLIKIELAYEAITGVLGIVSTAEKAWVAYSRAVRASAAAHAALALAQKASKPGVASALGTAESAAGSVANGAGLAAGGAKAAGMAAHGAPMGLWAAALIGGGLGINSILEMLDDPHSTRGQNKYVAEAEASMLTKVAGFVNGVGTKKKDMGFYRRMIKGVYEQEKNWIPGVNWVMRPYEQAAESEEKTSEKEKSRRIVEDWKETAGRKAGAKFGYESELRGVDRQFSGMAANYRMESVNTNPLEGGNTAARFAEALNETAKAEKDLEESVKRREAVEKVIYNNQEEMAKALQEERADAEKLVETRIREHGELIKLKQLKAEMAREGEQYANQEASRATAEMRGLRDRNYAQAERWNEMGPGKQHRFNNALDDLKAGRPLSNEKAKLLREGGVMDMMGTAGLSPDIAAIRNRKEQGQPVTLEEDQKLADADRRDRNSPAAMFQEEELKRSTKNGNRNPHDEFNRGEMQQRQAEYIRAATVQRSQHDLNIKIQADKRSTDLDFAKFLESPQAKNALKTTITKLAEELMKALQEQKKEPTTPNGKDQAYQLNGRMAAVAGQV